MIWKGIRVMVFNATFNIAKRYEKSTNIKYRYIYVPPFICLEIHFLNLMRFPVTTKRLFIF